MLPPHVIAPSPVTPNQMKIVKTDIKSFYRMKNYHFSFSKREQRVTVVVMFLILQPEYLLTTLYVSSFWERHYNLGVMQPEFVICYQSVQHFKKLH